MKWRPKRLNPTHRAIARLFSLGLDRKKISSIVGRVPQVITELRSNSPEFNLKVNEMLEKMDDGLVENRKKVERELSQLSLIAVEEAAALLRHPEPKYRYGSVWEILDRTGHAAPSKTSVSSNITVPITINPAQVSLIQETLTEMGKERNDAS